MTIPRKDNERRHGKFDKSFGFPESTLKALSELTCQVPFQSPLLSVVRLETKWHR